MWSECEARADEVLILLKHVYTSICGRAGDLAQLVICYNCGIHILRDILVELMQAL